MVRSQTRQCHRQPQAQEFVVVAERRLSLQEHAQEQEAGTTDVQVVKAVKSVTRRYLQLEPHVRWNFRKLPTGSKNLTTSLTVHELLNAVNAPKGKIWLTRADTSAN